MTAWENEWKLHKDLPLMGNPDVSRLRFVLHGSGNFKYYLIEHEPGELGAPWKDCCLVPRGNKPLVYDGDKPLPPWDADDTYTVEAYDKAIKSTLDRSHSGTNRLECELEMAGEKRWAMLFMIRDAVDNGTGGTTDLLVVRYGSDFKWSASGGAAAPIEDGTGHGNRH